MKKIPCDLFEEGQFLYFNISKFAQLETLINKPIMQVMMNGQFSITDIVKMYMIGLSGKQKTETYYMNTMQERLEEGYTLQDFVLPLTKAVIGSGLLGKEAYYSMFPEEMTEEDKIAIECEKK